MRRNKLFSGKTIKIRYLSVSNESEKRRLFVDVRLLGPSLVPKAAEKIAISPDGFLLASNPGKKIEVPTKCLEEAICKPKSRVTVMF